MPRYHDFSRRTGSKIPSSVKRIETASRRFVPALGTFGDASPENVLGIDKPGLLTLKKFEEEQKIVLDLKFGRGLKIVPRARHYEYESGFPILIFGT